MKDDNWSRVGDWKLCSMTAGRLAVVEITDGKFSLPLDVETVVDQILTTVMRDGAVMQLVVTQSLQRSNQRLSL